MLNWTTSRYNKWYWCTLLTTTERTHSNLKQFKPPFQAKPLKLFVIMIEAMLFHTHKQLNHLEHYLKEICCRQPLSSMAHISLCKQSLERLLFTQLFVQTLGIWPNWWPEIQNVMQELYFCLVLFVLYVIFFGFNCLLKVILFNIHWKQLVTETKISILGCVLYKLSI